MKRPAARFQTPCRGRPGGATRPGYSLIEMLVVISISSIMLGLATALLGALFQAERRGRDDVVYTFAMARLADQFRHDVRAATRSLPAEEKPETEDKTGQTIQLVRFETGANEEVEYRQADGELWRIEQRPGLPPRREAYRLPRSAQARASNPPEFPGMVRLWIETELETGAIVETLRVEAALGAAHRFHGSEE